MTRPSRSDGHASTASLSPCRCGCGAELVIACPKGCQDAELGLVADMDPIARELATAREDRRLTVADLRHEAVKRGVLTGAEQGRRLSFLHAVMPAAGFEPTADFERSNIPRSHRNLNRVHWLPEPAGMP